MQQNGAASLMIPCMEVFGRRRSDGHHRWLEEDVQPNGGASLMVPCTEVLGRAAFALLGFLST